MSSFCYFGPDGYACSDVLCRGWRTPDVKIDEDGKVTDWTDGNGQDPEPWTAGGETTLISDGTEWLMRHCRLVEVYEGFDVWGREEAIEPWPDEVIAKCVEVRQLEHGLEMLREARTQFDPSFFDAVVEPVWNAIVIGKAKARLEALEAEIAAFRKDRIEPTKLEEPEDTHV